MTANKSKPPCALADADWESYHLLDDQILLELGQSDEYAGDDKTRFMAGLRQLLTEFRAAKVKDFASIAQGIVDYRRRFLNDSSKVLRLEGVHI